MAVRTQRVSDKAITRRPAATDTDKARQPSHLYYPQSSRTRCYLCFYRYEIGTLASLKCRTLKGSAVVVISINVHLKGYIEDDLMENDLKSSFRAFYSFPGKLDNYLN